MVNGNLQYLNDSLLIEKIFLIEAGLTKQANIAGNLLGSIAGSIMEWGKSHIDTSSPNGIISSLSDLMFPGVLFKINPILGGLATIAQALGFSPASVVKDIIGLIQEKLNSGTFPTLIEVNNIGKEAVAKEAGPMLIEANNMLDLLYKIEDSGKLVSLVRTAQARSLPEIPFFGGKGGVIERIFGDLFKMKAKNKAKWLLGGFVVWIIKTVLLGAGLIAAGEKVVSLFQNNESEAPKTENNSDLVLVNNQNSPQETVSYRRTLTPTGRGQDHHINDHKTSTWVIPLIGGSVEATLIAWAKDIYKEFAETSIATETEAFNRTVQEMKQGLESSGSNQLTVPSKFKSRKQVVDQFV